MNLKDVVIYKNIEDEYRLNYSEETGHILPIQQHELKYWASLYAFSSHTVMIFTRIFEQYFNPNVCYYDILNKNDYSVILIVDRSLTGGVQERDDWRPIVVRV